MLVLDRAARMWVVTHRFAPLDNIFWFLSVIGRGGMVWLAAAAAIAVVRRDVRPFAITLFAVLVASALADQVLKPAVGRTRPFEILAGDVIGGRPNDSSFPSGHSANAFAAAAILSRVAPAASAGWWTLAVLIAFSRVYLGVHFPLDVIGGAALGIASAWIALRLARFSKL